jgi:hypothetical protein
VSGGGLVVGRLTKEIVVAAAESHLKPDAIISKNEFPSIKDVAELLSGISRSFSNGRMFVPVDLNKMSDILGNNRFFHRNPPFVLVFLLYPNDTTSKLKRQYQITNFFEFLY